MDWVFILTVVAASVGVIAGIVQVVQYFQDRKKKALEKEELPAKIPAKVTASHQNLPPRGEFVGRETKKNFFMRH